MKWSVNFWRWWIEIVAVLACCPTYIQGEIRASAFNDVADKFHGMFELGKVTT